MIIKDLKSPVFKVILDHDTYAVEKKTMELCKEGWCPVGTQGRRNNDWVQVLVKEESNASNSR